MIGLTRSDAIFDTLYRQIMSGELRPGDPLAEPEIARQLGVSRTPVREALDRLAERGLVTFHPNRRATVRSLRLDELEPIYEVRELLEGRAALRACGQLTAADFKELDRLARQARRGEGRRYAEANYQFDLALHRTVAQRSGNPLLAVEIRQLHELVQLGRHKIGDEPDAFQAAWDEHCRILTALREGRVQAAHDEMVRHIRSSCSFAMRRVAAEQSSVAAASVAAASIASAAG